MKNNIVFKFIAILLCTLMLLGSLGSAAGLYVMSEADLYHKTADQVRDELIWERGEILAHEAGLYYASQALGGCPEGMVNNYYGTYWKNDLFRSGHYAYRILDEEGNVVFSQGEITGSDTYTFPVEGQYLHLVSMESEQEKVVREAQERAERYSIRSENPMIEGVEIPAEGLRIDYAAFVSQSGQLVLEVSDDGGPFVVTYYDEHGSNTFSFGGDCAGSLMYGYDGHLVFRSNFLFPEKGGPNTLLREVNFVTGDGVHLRLRSDEGSVGQLYTNAEGEVCFASLAPLVPDNAETAPVPEPPELTIDPTPGLTSINNSLPPEGTPVVLAAFYGPDGAILYQCYDAAGLGFLYANQEGGVSFVLGMSDSFDQAAYLAALQDTVIAGVYFQNAQGDASYQAAGINGVGEADSSESRLVWKSVPAMTAPAPEEETQPAEAAEEASEEGASEEDAWEDQEENAEENQEENWEEPSSASEVPEEQPPEAYAETEPAEVETTAAAETVPVTETTAPPTEATEAVEETTVPPTEEPWVPTEPVRINGKTLDEYQLAKLDYYDESQEQRVYASYVRIAMPKYTVELELAPDAMQSENFYTILTILRDNRQILLPALGICLLCFAITVVYLCTAAGRKPKSDEVRAGGLNRLPLDLYFCLGAGLAAFAGITGVKALDRLGWNLVFNGALALGTAFCVCLILVAFGFAVVAQVKTPGGFWWRNTLCGHCVRLWFAFARWLDKTMKEKGWPFLLRLLKNCGKLIKASCVAGYRATEFLAKGVIRLCGRFFRWLGNLLHRFLSLLPMTWQWLLAGCAILFLSVLTMNAHSAVAGLLGIAVIMAILIYSAQCFGILNESARNMSKGDLEGKVDDKLMVGCFKEFAGDLNALADVAVVAAQKQLKSERMKTELITNVSHDIKTPLTSIINYVDLLQKPHTEQEQETYLEVLDRQSQRLKKLIDDLMDMSKASTGNMAVEITTVDAVESVNQALGEFSDKLAAARLTPVFRHAQEQVPMRADGKLVWRVLSNLLSNAVKYAMPGTRIYIDLMLLESKVVLSLKNISREELNVDAEELMERFVRGDDSRNTEGSGLGLNIAKSLMELQKGQLQLLVDGDLFKVTLIFPGE